MQKDCNKTMCGDLYCISCYPIKDIDEDDYPIEIEIDENNVISEEEIAAFVAIPPESLIYDRDDVLAEATALAQDCVDALPIYATPAQSRVGVKNMVKVYEKTSHILSAMLANRKGDLH